MDDKLVRAKVHTAVQQHCATSGVQPNPYLAQRVLAAARDEGVPVVKKKLSLGLVFILILLLTGTVALAATLLWQDYVPQMKQTEHEMGDYVEWPATRRIQLAKDIVAMGYLDESEDTMILSSETATEQDKAAAADRLMLKLTGLEDVKEIHSTLITYAIMGHEDTWTPEQRVWWNGIETMYGDDGATDTLIVPTKDVLSEEDAIAIARAAIQEAYGFDDAYMSSLHPVANLYTTDERPDYKRWDIQFKKYREGSSTYVEKVYSAVVDENGEVIADPDVAIEHPKDSAARSKAWAEQEANRPAYEKIYSNYAEQVNFDPFWTWTYTQKAACYAEIAPMVANLESLNREIAYATFYAYGVPAENEIQYENALVIGRKVLADEYGLTDKQIRAHSDLLEAYDVSYPDKPMWKFVFINPDDWYGTRYRVLINGRTGEIILHESFPWQRTFIDEEYDRKLY